MNNFFCPLLEMFCPLFKHFAQMGSTLPRLVHFAHFENQARKRGVLGLSRQCFKKKGFVSADFVSAGFYVSWWWYPGQNETPSGLNESHHGIWAICTKSGQKCSRSGQKKFNHKEVEPRAGMKSALIRAPFLVPKI